MAPPAGPARAPAPVSGYFCEGTRISFLGGGDEWFVHSYTVREFDRIEGQIPLELPVAMYDIVADYSYGWGDVLNNGLEVVKELPGDDDDSAGDDDDSASG